VSSVVSAAEGNGHICWLTKDADLAKGISGIELAERFERISADREWDHVRFGGTRGGA